MPESVTDQSVSWTRIVGPELERVRNLMAEQVRDLPVPDDIDPLLAYLGKRMGKMIRPQLVLLSGKTIGGGDSQEHIHVATIMEMIHTATLLHDDVIDLSDKRRGSKTANRLWGNETAVLLGDFVLTHVFRMCVDLERPVAQVVADTAAKVCRGELLQTLDRNGETLDEARYLEIIQDKSASFFSGCCLTGALVSNATPKQAKALQTFGLQVGMAFQMADDLIDVCGSETHAGKPVGYDVDTHLTLPVIHYLAQLAETERNRLDLTKIEDLTTRLEQSGSLTYVQQKCQQATQKAIQALDVLPDSEAKAALIDLAQYAGNRSS